jgi:hypothetical protein
MNIFSDHTGVIIDPFGVEISNHSRIASDMYGIRISPRQSPIYQSVVKFSYFKFYLFIFLFSQFMVQH